VRYISNLPFASDKKLCFTLWQLKWCRKSNAYNQTRTMSQIDDILWLQCIARGTLDNGSLTAAQFPVSSQKPCYDFKKMFQNQLFA
jgi:hypothetical protein